MSNFFSLLGLPNLPLYELVRSPQDLIDNPDLKLNYEYYVMKQILPPLDRIMCLLGKNVYEWTKALSFKPKVFQYVADSLTTTSNTLSNFIYSTDCILCGKKRDNMGAKTNQSLCQNCSRLDQTKFAKLKLKIQKCEQRFQSITTLCHVCTNSLSSRNECCSMDCPNTFMAISIRQDMKKTDYIRKVIDEYF